jgi:TFIIF-interacting CTD phosphatase-like protein
MKNMIIVDSNPYSYIYQFENGIPIIPFEGSKKDK